MGVWCQSDAAKPASDINEKPPIAEQTDCSTKFLVQVKDN